MGEIAVCFDYNVRVKAVERLQRNTMDRSYDTVPQVQTLPGPACLLTLWNGKLIHTQQPTL